MIAYQNSNSNIHSTTSDKKADTKRWKIETLQQSPLPKQPSLRLNSSYLNEPWIPFKDGTNSMCDCGSAAEATLDLLLQCQ